MLYFNDENLEYLRKELYGKDLLSIQKYLNSKGIEFGSIKRFENENTEIILNEHYILLGPLGGIAETKGKYDKYNCFDHDMEEYEETLKNDMQYITSGKIPIINLG